MPEEDLHLSDPVRSRAYGAPASCRPSGVFAGHRPWPNHNRLAGAVQARLAVWWVLTRGSGEPGLPRRWEPWSSRMAESGLVSRSGIAAGETPTLPGNTGLRSDGRTDRFSGGLTGARTTSGSTPPLILASCPIRPGRGRPQPFAEPRPARRRSNARQLRAPGVRLLGPVGAPACRPQSS